MEGKVCSKCGVWKPLEEYNKRKDSKDGRRSDCIECRKGHYRQYRQNNKEKIKESNKRYYKKNAEHLREYGRQYHKEHYKEYKEYKEEYYKKNAEHLKEYGRQYHKDNKEHYKEYKEEYYKKNAEHLKEYARQYRIENREERNKKLKQYHTKIKENNLQNISNAIKQIKPILKDLPTYGIIYLFINTKTKHCYVGQTTIPLKERYNVNIIKSWIRERKGCEKQKYLDELIENDFIVTEVLDIGICKYHLDKLEAYYINKYDSYNNGYNNNAGNHNTDDGIEEFNQILLENNLEFIDGKLVKIS